MGVDKHWIEKDLIKFFIKAFSRKPVLDIPAAPEIKEEEMKDEKDDKPEDKCEHDIPIKGVAKKRGKPFAFLQFADLEEKQAFEDQFTVYVAPVKRWRLRPVSKLDGTKGFKPVKGSTEMNSDSLRKKEAMHASVTQADVDAVLAETIEQRVTPYAQLIYADQLQKKHADLSKMLLEFSRVLDSDIKKNIESPPQWYASLEEKRIVLQPEIIHTDVLDGYRNKVEFTVGRGYAPPREGTEELWSPEGPINVGFNRGNLSKGISFVESGEAVRVNSANSLHVAKVFEQIVREGPKELEPFDKASGKGFWRILLYRESKVTK